MMKWNNIDTSLKAATVRALFFAQEATCNDLSHAVEKSVPIVTKTIGELIQTGWIEERGYATSSGGRKPMLYALKRQQCYLLAVSMNRLGLKMAILDMANNVVGNIQKQDLVLAKKEDALPELIVLLKNFLQTAPMQPNDIIGVGISMPGFINSESGVNYSYLRPPGQETLGQYISHQLQLPVYIDNDSSTLALAELRFGAARDSDVAMVLNIGWGIGLGMIVHHQLFRGYTGFAGELSHIPIFDNDIMCECGKKGCLETEATLLVISKKAIEIVQSGAATTLPQESDVYKMSDALMEAANQGNQEAIALISQMGYKIGKAIAILIHIENPELIVLSGRGALVGKYLLTSIQQALNTYCIPRLAKNTKLEISSLGANADLIGAAALVMENFDYNA